MNYEIRHTGTTEIETERLILRNYRLDDLEDYWEYMQMPNVGPRCGWSAYTDKENSRRFKGHHIALTKCEIMLPLMIIN